MSEKRSIPVPAEIWEHLKRGTVTPDDLVKAMRHAVTPTTMSADPEPEEAEPVAWIQKESLDWFMNAVGLERAGSTVCSSNFEGFSVPLYLHPPRPGVELSIAEIEQMKEENEYLQHRYHALANEMEYEGNSVAYIHQKMKAYRNCVDEVWNALNSIGIFADGKTSAPDAIRKINTRPAVRLSMEEIEDVLGEQKGKMELKWFLDYAIAIEAAVLKKNGLEVKDE